MTSGLRGGASCATSSAGRTIRPTRSPGSTPSRWSRRTTSTRCCTRSDRPTRPGGRHRDRRLARRRGGRRRVRRQPGARPGRRRSALRPRAADDRTGRRAGPGAGRRRAHLERRPRQPRRGRGPRPRPAGGVRRRLARIGEPIRSPPPTARSCTRATRSRSTARPARSRSAAPSSTSTTADVPAELDVLLGWADEVRAGSLGVRANADTAADAAPGPALRGRGHRPVPHRAPVPRPDRLPLVQRLILAEARRRGRGARRARRRAASRLRRRCSRRWTACPSPCACSTCRSTSCLGDGERRSATRPVTGASTTRCSACGGCGWRCCEPDALPDAGAGAGRRRRSAGSTPADDPRCRCWCRSCRRPPSWRWPASWIERRGRRRSGGRASTCRSGPWSRRPGPRCGPRELAASPTSCPSAPTTSPR